MSWLSKKIRTAHKLRTLHRVAKRLEVKVQDTEILEDVNELLESVEDLVEELTEFLENEGIDALIEELTDNALFQKVLKGLWDKWKDKL